MATPSCSYDAYQTTFTLSFAANAASSLTGDQSALQNQLLLTLSAFLTLPEDLKKTLPFVPYEPLTSVTERIGAWELVWGPVVFQREKSHMADNAMFVAYCDSRDDMPPTYVVAIAATNATDSFDWLKEDFDTSACVLFEGWDPSSPMPYSASTEEENQTKPVISMGTAMGVGYLLNLTVSGNAVGEGNLIHFLDNVDATAASKAQVIVTGHSLGGALSPTLGLFLQSQSDMGKRFESIKVYPSAGATPGNNHFSDLFKSTLPPIPEKMDNTPLYQSWNRDIVNQYDVVPHAWQEDRLEMIPDLYGTLKGATKEEVDLAVKIAKDKSKSSGATYTMLPYNELPGVKPPEPPSTFVKFMEDLGNEHVYEYTYNLILPLDNPFPIKFRQMPLVDGVEHVKLPV